MVVVAASVAAVAAEEENDDEAWGASGSENTKGGGSTACGEGGADEREARDETEPEGDRCEEAQTGADERRVRNSTCSPCSCVCVCSGKSTGDCGKRSRGGGVGDDGAEETKADDEDGQTGLTEGQVGFPEAVVLAEAKAEAFAIAPVFARTRGARGDGGRKKLGTGLVLGTGSGCASRVRKSTVPGKYSVGRTKEVR